MWGHDPQGFQYTYDIEKAKALLAESGKSDIRLTYTFSQADPAWEPVGLALQASLAEIGIKLDLQAVADTTKRELVANGKNYTLKDTEEIKKKYDGWDFIGGWDLGKKNHPAHFSVFARQGKKRVQLHDHWFDHEDYTEQLEYIQAHVDAWGMYKVYYDATRGELEMMQETGELPAEYEGVHFTFKAKHSMANSFDRAITAKEVTLLNVPRSISQILIVNGDLKAPTTPEGHGDCFWSICLTFMDENGNVDIHLA